MSPSSKSARSGLDALELLLFTSSVTMLCTFFSNEVVNASSGSARRDMVGDCTGDRLVEEEWIGDDDPSGWSIGGDPLPSGESGVCRTIGENGSLDVVRLVSTCKVRTGGSAEAVAAAEVEGASCSGG